MNISNEMLGSLKAEEEKLLKGITISNCKFEYNKQFIDIRKDYDYKGDSCYLCNSKFRLGDSIYLTFVKGTTNKLSCKCCHDKYKR